jgi:hypothetical protein
VSAQPQGLAGFVRLTEVGMEIVAILSFQRDTSAVLPCCAICGRDIVEGTILYIPDPEAVGYFNPHVPVHHACDPAWEKWRNGSHIQGGKRNG